MMRKMMMICVLMQGFVQAAELADSPAESKLEQLKQLTIWDMFSGKNGEYRSITDIAVSTLGHHQPGKTKERALPDTYNNYYTATITDKPSFWGLARKVRTYFHVLHVKNIVRDDHYFLDPVTCKHSSITPCQNSYYSPTRRGWILLGGVAVLATAGFLYSKLKGEPDKKQQPLQAR